MLVRVHQADPELRQKLHLNLVGDNGQAFVGLPNVSVHGPLTQEAIAEVLEKSDYVVSTSKSESFGLSIIEGASRGAIPIVPAGSAMAELVQILESGFEFEDEHMLNNIFQGVLHSSRPTKSQRQRLSQRAIEYFGPEMAFTRYADVYSEWGVK